MSGIEEITAKAKTKNTEPNGTQPMTEDSTTPSAETRMSPITVATGGPPSSATSIAAAMMRRSVAPAVLTVIQRER